MSMLSALVVLAIAFGGFAPFVQNPTEPAQLRLIPEWKFDGSVNDLVSISDIKANPRGLVAFTQPEDFKVQILTKSGSHLATVGRKGSGPREFRYPSIVGWLGDTLWVFDVPLQGVTLFSAEGKYLSNQAVRMPQSTAIQRSVIPSFSTVIPRAVHKNSDLTVIGMLSSSVRSTPHLIGSWVLDLTNNGVIKRRVAFVPTIDPGKRMIELGNGISIGIPFSWSTHTDVSNDGSRVVVVEADPRTKPAVLKVTIADVSVKPVTLQIPFRPVPIPKARLDSSLTRLSARHGLATNRSALERLRHAIPEHLPPVKKIFVGSDKRIWIELQGIRPEREWLILNQSGRPTGFVRVSPNISLMTANSEAVWGVERDEYDVPTVVRYRIDVSRPPAS